MGSLGLVVRLGALHLGYALQVLSRAAAAVRVPEAVRGELATRQGAAARLAILSQAKREARFYGLSEEALGVLLVQLGRDVRAGRFRP